MEDAPPMRAAPAALLLHRASTQCKSIRLLVNESNSLFQASGEPHNHPPHSTEVGDNATTASGNAQRYHSKCLKVNAMLVVYHQLPLLKIVPDIFSQMRNVEIPIDEIEGISARDDNFADLEEAEIGKAVVIEYMSECCRVSESVCFLVESRRARQAFIKSLTSMRDERRSQQSPPQSDILSVRSATDGSL